MTGDFRSLGCRGMWHGLEVEEPMPAARPRREQGARKRLASVVADEQARRAFGVLTGAVAEHSPSC